MTSSTPLVATRAVVADPLGEPTTLTLYTNGGEAGSITAECVASAPTSSSPPAGASGAALQEAA
jgi:hypothetical protein